MAKQNYLIFNGKRQMNFDRKVLNTSHILKKQLTPAA